MKVEALSTKSVNTKRGPAETSSIKCDDGNWYALGFNKHAIKKGDEIEFEFENTRYGNVVKFETIKLNGSAAPVVSKPSGSAPSYERKSFTPAAANRPFPIPLLHGDRAIIRQNSLTNAVKVFVGNDNMLHKGADDKLIKEAASCIIELAKHFEEYSCGDVERRNAEKASK